MDFKASSQGKGEPDRTNDGVPVDRAQEGLEDVLAWLRRMACSILTYRKVSCLLRSREK